MMVNSRHSWTVRGERLGDPSVVHGGAWLEPVLAWPSIPELRERWALDAAHDALYQKAPAHAWLLMRDLEPVAVFDPHGRLRGAHGQSVCRGLLSRVGVESERIANWTDFQVQVHELTGRANAV